MKKHNKVFATICAVVMIFGAFSCPTNADGNNPTAINQASINTLGDKMPTAAGSYVLTEDINVSKSAQIDTDGAEISIDLNGHTITYAGENLTESMYIIGKVNGWTVKAGCVQLTVSNGTITTGSGYIGGGSTDHWISSGNAKTDSNRGGCFLIQYSSTLTLNDVNISGFHAGNEGGAIHISNGSFLVMNGGSIENCTAVKGGGAISVNAASTSPYTRIDGTSSTTYNLLGSATINGSKISGNEAGQLGGGIRSNRASVYLSDCEITGNNVISNGTGKDFGGGGVQILGASNGQKVKIQGNMQVIGNTCGNPNKANFYMQDRTVELSGALDSNAKIAFGTMPEYEPNTTKGYFSVGSYSYSLDNFLCDNGAYVPVYDSSNKVIKMSAATAPSFDSMNVSIAGNIALNVRVNLGSFANNNTTITYEYSYTKNTTKKVSKTLTLNDLTQDGNLYMFSIPVESACMTAPITMSINYGVNGKVTPSNVITIENYARDVIEGSNPQKAKDIAAALVDFGGYAQVQFEINTDNPPTLNNKDYTQPYAAPAISGASFTPNGDSEGAFAGATLSMLSETSINLYFKKSVLGSTAPEMTVTFTSNGASVQPTVTSKGSYYIYTIAGRNGSGFKATEYNDTFTFSINGISGDYSVLTYLQTAKNNTSNTQALVNLVEAYYNFTQVCSN